jgi:hypothetical protein
MFGRRLINTGGEAVIPTSFNTVLYTGNGSTQSITGVGFQPDFVWIKSRSAATSHKLTDIVRGTTKALVSNTTAAETTDANGLTAFSSDGFTLGTDSVYNNSGATYVAWCWKAGGAAVTNTDGSITSEVSANVDAGFSVVKYTGNNNASASVAHSLGVSPNVVIIKNLDVARSWAVRHSDIDSTKNLYLNSTVGETLVSSTAQGGVGALTSNTFGFIQGDALGNVNTVNSFIAYCFAEKAGFSKFGSYTGNGSATGPTVTTDFEPAFVMVKRTDSTGNWVILDNKRDASNPIDKTLNPNLSDAESTANDIDFNATTFQLKSTNADTNANTATYIYMAFANQF